MTALSVRTDRLRTDRTPFVLATVVRAERPTSARTGDRALVLPDGTLEGFVGGTCAASTVRTQALRLLESGESTLLRITPEPEEQNAEGMLSVTNPCLSGGTLDIFLEAVIPPTLIQVFGDGPVARALVDVGAATGYDVRPAESPATPITPDAAAVVIASHGRDEDDVLNAALRAEVPYIGLIASPRRGAAVIERIEGGRRVRTPAGLDIGARTAPEIALSVIAEIVSVRPRPVARPATPTVGQAGSAGQAGAAGQAGPAPVVAAQRAIDPVCGMEIVVTTATAQLEHAGRVWSFCGPGCVHAFIDDPDRHTP
ncbi:XdhC family protein [Actinomadura sp. HBU206391]|uniref:XdhC family protein n=1 Tax=Actinomadura sp. HBU206391 TaxID=2731692 RepID=UPI0016503F95|nr:XdhC family protein [Actinomadura sp. HBU206391]MBC6459746.1 XdhC family protein [Actinomadura sp. HBU206391]